MYRISLTLTYLYQGYYGSKNKPDYLLSKFIFYYNSINVLKTALFSL